jgi:hypothetical protein
MIITAGGESPYSYTSSIRNSLQNDHPKQLWQFDLLGVWQLGASYLDFIIDQCSFKE